MRRLVVLLLTLLLVPAATASSPASGLRGVVTISPAYPVCIEGRPCSKPGTGVTLVFRKDGGVAARVKAGTGGAYRIALRPGRYAVTTLRGRVGWAVTPSVVRVPALAAKRVDFEVDPGLQ